LKETPNANPEADPIVEDCSSEIYSKGDFEKFYETNYWEDTDGFGNFKYFFIDYFYRYHFVCTEADYEFSVPYYEFLAYPFYDEFGLCTIDITFT